MQIEKFTLKAQESLQEAKAIAEKGATVIMGCRDKAKSESAVKKIKETVPDAKVCVGDRVR